MSNIQIITLLIAIIGAVLGIINTWKNFDRDRIRLKVLPQTGIFPELGSQKRILTIQIINLSGFPITVSEIGFELSDSPAMRFQLLPSLDVGTLPHRLDARAAVIAEFDTDAYDDRYMRRVRRAYATTACGHTFNGTSPSLGVFHQGEWYVEAPAFGEDKLRSIWSRRRAKKKEAEKSEHSYQSDRQEPPPKKEPNDGDIPFARILGLTGRVTKEDVKRRWRELAMQYHPDKVAHLGPKLKQLAEEEMKTINEAYDHFRTKYKI